MPSQESICRHVHAVTFPPSKVGLTTLRIESNERLLSVELNPIRAADMCQETLRNTCIMIESRCLNGVA
jgi:hypothetical protein